MKKSVKLFLCALVFITCACEDKETRDPDFIINTNVPSGKLFSGFSFEKMNIITGPNSGNIFPDFMVGCFMNDVGDIGKPYLVNPNLEDRFILLNSYDNAYSAQNYFDTLSTIKTIPYDIFGFDIKPFEIWQIKTSSAEVGLILIVESRAEKIGSSAFAEIKFKARRIMH